MNNEVMKMIRGKTISIFLPDGNPRSFKKCEITNSNVEALFIPRNKIDEIPESFKLDQPGIYFLIGEEEDQLSVYIGEAEQLSKRIKQHNIDTEKDFWKTAICFVSVKSINKAHIKFLENYCHDVASKVNRCVLKNNNTPTKSKLSDSDEQASLGFFDDLNVLISTLGYPIFDEIKKDKDKLLFCKGKDAYAEGELTEDGLVVFKGSKINLEESKTAGSWIINMRYKLKEKGIIKQEDNVYVFVENYLFNSPSASAAVVLARRANGWVEWKYKSNNKSIDEVIRKN